MLLLGAGTGIWVLKQVPAAVRAADKLHPKAAQSHTPLLQGSGGTRSRVRRPATGCEADPFPFSECFHSEGKDARLSIRSPSYCASQAVLLKACHTLQCWTQGQDPNSSWTEGGVGPKMAVMAARGNGKRG